MNDFDKYFEVINGLDTSLTETKAYIKGIYVDHMRAERILSPKESITIKYIEAKNFEDSQILADWIFFIRTMYPRSLKASPDYYDSIAKNSYHRCHLLMNKQWPVFDEMSNRFTFFADSLQSHI